MKICCKSILILLVVIFFLSCNESNNRWQKRIPDIDIGKVEIERYEKELFRINTNKLRQELTDIADKYAFFLDADLEDTLNLIQIYEYITDPKLIILYEESEQQFKDLTLLKEGLSGVFKNFKFYFPEEKIPEVYTYISGIQFEQPVIYADSVLIIGLDNYLGEDYSAYKHLGLPKYMRNRMNPSYIMIDCVKAISSSKMPASTESRTLLDEMIKRGKQLYLSDLMLPNASDSIKIGYSSRQISWCKENESEIWAFIIRNELLYSADFLTTRKFLQDGPFTKGFGKKSPGRLGEWIGWQIVRSFMNNNRDTDINELLEENNAQKILKSSGYKPT